MTTWTWRYETEDGNPLNGLPPRSFDNQSDAESWLGESWEELLAEGVHQVSLLHDDARIYGPMGLNPT